MALIIFLFGHFLKNYTDIGFKKIKAPDHVWKLVKDFWDVNKDDHSKENWPSGNTYSKYYTSFPFGLNFNNTSS